MSSVPVPGLCGLLRNPSSRRMKALNRNPEAQASGEHRCRALLRVQLRDDLSPRRKTAVRTSAITMRPGWLAQAAFVFAAPSSSTPVRLVPCGPRGPLLFLVTQHGDECHRFLPPRRLNCFCRLSLDLPRLLAFRDSMHSAL
jgi:hypothetical protein